MNSDQLHRSTLGIYSNLMEEFNPSLQRLVLLGNSYVQAFKALAVTSEAYFSTLSKLGEKAFHTASSQPLGNVLIQICENQRRLTSELDGVFGWFNMEVLQQMESNIRLDKDYLSDSRNRYEIQVYNQGHPRRGSSLDYGEHMQFLRESHREALMEEERRYRFLAEKHSELMRSFGRHMNKLGGSLQQKADAWSEDANATRQLEDGRPAALDANMGMRREEIRRSRDELLVSKVPSRAASPLGSISLSAAGSLRGYTGGRSARALVSHQPAGSNPNLLPFTKGEIITVLVQQPRKGWLYGCTDSSSCQGWFPVSYVESVDEPNFYPVNTISSSNSSLRGGSSSSRSSSSSMSGVMPPSPAPPPPPPPPPSLSSNRHPETKPITPTPDRRVEPSAEIKRPKPHGSQPELFPRGTNPFATIKLRPTSTDDRSAPKLDRR